LPCTVIYILTITVTPYSCDILSAEAHYIQIAITTWQHTRNTKLCPCGHQLYECRV